MAGANGTRSSKRKQDLDAGNGRPQKQHRLNGQAAATEEIPDIEQKDVLMPMEDEMDDISRLAAAVGAPADTAEWQATVENVIRNVVSIRFCQTCSFDTDAALTSEATGFVVDAERG